MQAASSRQQAASNLCSKQQHQLSESTRSCCSKQQARAASSRAAGGLCLQGPGLAVNLWGQAEKGHGGAELPSVQAASGPPEHPPHPAPTQHPPSTHPHEQAARCPPAGLHLLAPAPAGLHLLACTCWHAPGGVWRKGPRHVTSRGPRCARCCGARGQAT